MGPSKFEAPLGLFLNSHFVDLKLIHERVEETLWRGFRDDRDVAIRCIPHWAFEASDQEEQSRRFKTLESLDLGSYPKPLEQMKLDNHTVLVEEWSEGLPWNEAVFSRQSALRASIELFDLLSDLHNHNILHRQISPEQILISPEGRLKLLGLLGNTVDPDRETKDDLAEALGLLREHLTDDELSALTSLQSARSISRGLARLSSDSQPERSEPSLIGRDRFLKAIDQKLGSGGLITIEAPAGGGKTRLIREWAKRSNIFVLWGKANRKTAPSPFQILQGPLSQIEAHLGGDIDSPLRSLGSQFEQQRSTMVWLAKLLDEFQTEYPTVLVLEDLHWADDFTLEFIQYWNHHPGKTLLLVSFRPEELEPDHPLLTLRCQRIKLPKLSRSQATKLLRSVHPGASKTLIESAIKRADGNPFLLLQFVRSGTLSGDFLEVRLSTLSEEAQRTLAVASILGEEFDRELLQFCLGGEPALGPCLEDGLLQKQGSRYRFTHDRFRDSCLTLLDDPEMIDVHLKVAEYESKQNEPDPFRVAYHYQLGQRPDVGLPFAREAAHRAETRHDLGTATYYYQAALSGHPEKSVATELLFRLGDCYRLLGRYKRSEKCFTKALVQSTDPIEKVNIHRALGDVYFKQAQLEKARSAVEEGLSILGHRQPRWLLASFIYQGSVLAFRTACRRSALFGPLLDRRLQRSDRQTELLKASLYNRLAYVAWFLEGPIPSIWAHFCEMNLVEQHGNTVELSLAQSTHAIAMSAIPWWTRALTYGARSITTARSINARWSEGQGGHFYGGALLAAGRTNEARQVLTEALKILEETGDRWEENGVSYHLALAYYRLGALEKATELAIRTHRAGVEINDRLAAGDNLYTWARARNGAIPREVIEKEKKFSSPDLQRTCELLGAEAMIDLHEQKYVDAEARFAEAVQRYAEKRARSLYVASLPCWLATTRRLLVQSTSGQARADWLKKFRSALRTAVKFAKSYPVNLPHALREQALSALFDGRHAEVKRYLNKSITVAEELGSAQEASTSRAVLNYLNWMLGESSATPQVDPPWILGLSRSQQTDQDKLEALLSAATQLSQCLSVPTVLHHLCRGCKKVFSRRYCSVVSLNQDGEWALLSGDSELDLPVTRQPTSELNQQWTAHTLVSLDPPAFLLLSTDDRFDLEEQLLDFLLTVAAAALDRADRTASSMALSLHLKHSTALLDEEASRLFQAREQLLLSERLALTGRLATGLVHDLRNLVLAINGCAETLKLDLGEQHTNNLDEILQAGRKSNQLLSQLNNLTRGESFGPQRIDLNQRLTDARPLLRSLCGPLVELEFQHGETETVQIDPVGLDRVLLNLVMNARDAVPPGGQIEVSTSIVETQEIQDSFPCPVPAGRYCLLTVKDDGCGIPEEVLPRVFELHFTTKDEMNSGIGLVTVLEIVRASNGYLVVDSGPDGTEFKLYFPPL